MDMDMDKLVFRIAAAVGRRFGIFDTEELISEAWYLMGEALNRYDESRGVSRKTFVRNAIANGLFNFCKHQKRRPAVETIHGEDRANAQGDHSYWIAAVLDLGDDALFIVNTILAAPREWAQLSCAKNKRFDARYRGMTRRYLKSLGWRESRINLAFENLGAIHA